jgi:hypothetical protein
MWRYLIPCTICIAFVACVPPTKFEGQAKFPDGVGGCRRACQHDGLEFGGFVYSGEFATSCICQPPAAQGTAAGIEANPTAGVVVQTQAAAAAAAANNSQQFHMQQQRRQQQSH